MSFCVDAQAGFWDELKAKVEATRLATIKAGKLPPVKLTEKQMASLSKETVGRGRIVWLGAGREKDGKNVCLPRGRLHQLVGGETRKPCEREVRG
jgi:hypothetical protein